MKPDTDATPYQSPPTRATRWLWLGLQAELALFRRPMFVLSVLAIVLVPSLYAVFYISSLWDPYGHLDRLPAALVNLDRGVIRAGRDINVGNTTIHLLTEHPPFHFVQLPSVEAADEALRSGKVYFALIIPGDFSERAITAGPDEPAEFTLRVAEGDSYMGATISKRFGSELAHTLNEQLNRERWALIQGDPAVPSGISVRAAIAQLRDGSQRVHEGAQRVQAGAGQVDRGLDKAADGTTRLNDAIGQIAAGVRVMRGRLPPETRLQELADGSTAALAGEEKLEAGINQLVPGGQRLDQGADALRRGAAKVPFAGHRLSAGAAQLENGMATLETNLVLVAAGGRQLDTGLAQLNDGIQPLTGGILQLETGLDTMIARLPAADPATAGTTAASQLRNGGGELTNGMARLREGSRQLVEGSRDLEAGSASLALGLDRLNTSFTEGFGDADIGGLAAPVRMKLETSTPLPNNGTAFSPYFAALTLWLGGIMITFVFHCRRLIESMREAPRWVWWATKAFVPLGLGALQATTVVVVLHFGFGIFFVHPCLVWLAAILGSFTFVSLILLLIAVFGDAGRLPAVILLILQLASAGGIYPVELSGRFYETIHPFMPFTALVNLFRAAMFGAYDGALLLPAVQLAVTGGCAVILAICFARWKFIPCGSYGPAVEFS